MESFCSLESFENIPLEQHISGKILYSLAIRKAFCQIRLISIWRLAVEGIIIIFWLIGGHRPAKILYQGICYPKNYGLLCIWCDPEYLNDYYVLHENILSPSSSSNNFLADRPNFQVVAMLATWANFGSTTWKAIASNSVHQHTYIPIASSDI